MKPNKRERDLDELRRRAEEKLREREEKIVNLPVGEIKELIHEVGTYQIELEIQNEDLRNAQELLEESRRKYVELYDLAPVGYLTLDKNAQVKEMNLTAAKLLGMERNKLLFVPTTFLRFIAPEDKTRFVRHFKEALAGKELATVEVRVKRHDEGYFHAQFQTSVQEETAEPLLRTAFIDVTELREAEAARKRAEESEREAKEEAELLRLERLESLRVLAGGIAHDLNNLMVAVSANAGLALRHLPGSSPARELIEGIEKAVAKVSSFSKQILSFTGKMEAVKENISMNEAVKDAAHLLLASFSKNVVIEFNLTEGLPSVYADPQNIQQVVTNLILNAEDAIGVNRGVIKVSTGKIDAGVDYLSTLYPSNLAEDEYVYVKVSDTGRGMSEETKKRIFEPFFTTKFTGQGLGLSAVLGILNKHGGAVGLESDEGRGSTFMVLLPVSHVSRQTQSAAPVSQDIWNGNGKILVVDDEPDSLQMTRKVLETAGYKVLTANDGAEAIRVFQENKNSVSTVVMDLIMPSIRGDEAAKEIRKIKGGVNILLLSGYHEIDLGDLKEGPGRTAILEKPYRINVLVEKVNDISKV